MNRIAVCLVLFVLVRSLGAQQAGPGQVRAAAEKEPPAPNALQPLERFNNRQMSVLRAGKPVPSHITIRDWEIHGRQKIEKFPETGVLIVSLHSGTIVTTIAGKEAKRLPGDFWTVPAGTTMGVQVTSESAGLHIVAITKP